MTAITNVMTPVVVKRYPQVQQALDWLQDKAPSGTEVAMSGSGSCVFAGLENEADCRSIASHDLPPDWKLYVVRGLDDSPLVAMLGNTPPGH